MAKPTRNASVSRTQRLSETDKNLLELLGRFCIRAKHSTWETVNHANEIEAVALLNEVSQQLTTYEYDILTIGWSDYRLYGKDQTLNDAVEVITHRLQEKTETF